jgi:hypothetical protein
MVNFPFFMVNFTKIPHFHGKFSKMAHFHGEYIGVFSLEICTNGNITVASMMKIPIHVQNVFPCFG